LNAIPYTVEPRPDTGVNNVKLGMWLFLASEAMLFAGLFSAYFMLRAGAEEPWTPLRHHLDAAVASTVMLFGGTAAFAAAVRMARRNRGAAFRGWMIAATILPLLFLPYKALQYVDLAEAHFYPSSSTQAATYFLLTGVHALHVAAGVFVNAWLAATRTSTFVASAPFLVNRLEATALYWYFVDVVWLVLVVLLYVV
jgi:heme/copper-type cytochrome/quinol oxidase subunit 3